MPLATHSLHFRAHTGAFLTLALAFVVAATVLAALSTSAT